VRVHEILSEPAKTLASNATLFLVAGKFTARGINEEFSTLQRGI
jgi:hypothetical protein